MHRQHLGWVLVGVPLHRALAEIATQVVQHNHCRNLGARAVNVPSPIRLLNLGLGGGAADSQVLFNPGDSVHCC